MLEGGISELLIFHSNHHRYMKRLQRNAKSSFRPSNISCYFQASCLIIVLRTSLKVFEIISSDIHIYTPERKT